MNIRKKHRISEQQKLVQAMIALIITILSLEGVTTKYVSAKSDISSDNVAQLKGVAQAPIGMPFVDARDAVQYVNLNGIRVIKVNLSHPEIRVRAIQANDAGGVETVQSMAVRHNAIAAINGDYFSYFDQAGTTWPEGMMYIDGNDLTRCRLGFDCAHWRRSIAFSNNDRPSIGRDRSGRDLYNVVAGGPQFMFGGQFQWNLTVQGNCPSSGQVTINDEVFGCSAANWNNANTISAIGYSDDGNTLYFAASEGNKTMQEMHDVLWQQGARHALRLDSGGSRTLYYNGNGGQWTLGGERAVANAIAILPVSTSSTPPPSSGTWERDSNCGSAGVTIYEHSNYTGGCLHTSGSAYTHTLRDYNFNDIASSVQIEGNYVLYLWRDDDRGGEMKEITQDVPNLANWSFDNEASSAEVQPPGTCKRLNTNTYPNDAGTVNVIAARNCGNGFTSGTLIQLIANANPGFSFSYWSGSVSGNSSTTSFQIYDDNSSVTANFTTNSTSTPTVMSTGITPSATPTNLSTPIPTETQTNMWTPTLTSTSVPSITPTWTSTNTSSQTITCKVTTSGDDAWEYQDGGRYDQTGWSVSFGNRSGVKYVAGLRFANCPIPSRAIINLASLKVTSYGSNSSAAQFVVRGEKVANSLTFSASNGPRTRITTVAQASWQPGAWNWLSSYTSPDISSIIQEIVNLPEWISGNSLSLIVFDNSASGSYREIYSRDYANGSRVAELSITYTGGGSLPNTVTPTVISTATSSSMNTPTATSIVTPSLTPSISPTPSPTIGLSAPQLLSPSNNGQSSNLTPTFDWTDVSGATSYRLQVSSFSSFSSITIDTITMQSTYTPSQNLLRGRRYYWRVLTQNGGTSSIWSAVWSFTTPF